MPSISGFLSSSPDLRPPSIMSRKLKKAGKKIRSKFSTASTAETTSRNTLFPDLRPSSALPKSKKEGFMKSAFSSGAPASEFVPKSSNDIEEWRKKFRRDPSMQQLWADMRAHGLETPWDPAWKRVLDRVLIPIEDAAERFWTALEDAVEEAFVFTAVGLGVWGLSNVERAANWKPDDGEDENEQACSVSKEKTDKAPSASKTADNSGYHTTSSVNSIIPQQPRRRIRHKRTFSEPISLSQRPYLHDKSVNSDVKSLSRSFRPTTKCLQSHQPSIRSNCATKHHLASVANTISLPITHGPSAPAPSLNYLRLKHSRNNSVTSTRTSATMSTILSAATTNETSLWDELRLVVSTNSVEDILGSRKVPGVLMSRDVFPRAFDEEGCLVVGAMEC